MSINLGPTPATARNLAEVVAGCQTALAFEIEEAKRRPAVYDLRSGALSDRMGGSSTYTFPLPFDPGAPDEVKLIVDGRTLEAVYAGWDEKQEAVSVVISEDFGFSIPEAKLLASSWDLLVKLRDSLAYLEAKSADSGRDFVNRVAGLPSNPPAPSPLTFAPTVGLNPGQSEALDLVAANDLSFIWGPPGTGKTQTVAALAAHALTLGKRLLLVAHANVAVDGLLARVVDRFERDPEFFARGVLLRYGKTITPAIKARFGNFYEAGKVIDRRANWLQQQRLAGELKESELRRRLDSLEDRLVADSAIVATTLTQTYLKPDLYESRFDWVVIDEGSVANLPQAMWAASLASEKLVIAGDFRQLPPVVQARAAEPWLSRDPFEASGVRESVDADRTPPETLAVLRTQYRMAPAICEVVNSISYQAYPLQTASEVLARAPDSFPFGPGALFYVDTSTLETSSPRAASQNRTNPLHQELVRGLAYKLRQSGWLGSFDEQLHSLGVVSPYRAQARDLRKILNKDSRYGGVGWKGMASVDTAHRFQGSEVDCVILDLTDGPGGEVLHHGFLGARQPNETGARLTNVAISRARRHLILVGSFAYFRRVLPPNATTSTLARALLASGVAIDPQTLLNAAQESALAPASAPARWPSSYSRARR